MRRTLFARSLAASMAAAALMFSPGVSALAVQADNYTTRDHPTPPPFSHDDKDSILAEFERLGVDEEVADNLLAKLENGEIWDSMKPGTIPVSTIERRNSSSIETVSTYADGSVAVSTTSNLEEIQQTADRHGMDGNSELQPASVYGCSYRSGGAYAGYWRNCTADVNLVLVRMGFKFDYETVRGRGSKITGYRSYFHHIFGGALSNFRFDRISSTQVRLSADSNLAFKGFPVGWTAWMQANVSGPHAWTTHN